MDQGLISLDDNEAAMEEAIAEKYFINLRGKMQIEEKADLKELIGRSPDRWDARKLGIWGMQFAPVIRPIDAQTRERRMSMVPDRHSYMGS